MYVFHDEKLVGLVIIFVVGSNRGRELFPLIFVIDEGVLRILPQSSCVREILLSFGIKLFECTVYEFYTENSYTVHQYKFLSYECITLE